MSVNNIKKLSEKAIGTKQKKKLLDLKPIRYTKVDSAKIEDVSDKFKKALQNELDVYNAGNKPVVSEKEVSRLDSAEVSNLAQTKEEALERLYDLEKQFEGVTDEDYIPDEYKFKFGETEKFERVDVPEINEEEIKANIISEEEQKLAKEKEKLESELQKEIEAILGVKESAKNEAKVQETKINQIYDDLYKSAENDALRRGLQRSSAVIFSLDGIGKERAQALSDNAKELSSTLLSLEGEITNLSREFEKALSDMDVESSLIIQSKVEEKLAELEKKRNEAIEFNNNVSKLEAENSYKKLDKIEDAMELEETLRKKYEGAAQADKENKMFDEAFAYFDSIDQTRALKELIYTPELAKLLGSRYYDLYYQIMRKR